MLLFPAATLPYLIVPLPCTKIVDAAACEKVPEDPAELHQVMFKKNLTSSKDTSAYKKPKKKVDDGSAKRERRRLLRQAKRQKKAR